ncbi:FAD-dependent oxidoreductase [Pseudomonas sp.]|uniref:FAD-dependent oxidoreductase n=1 Tax=Pseudomonas sp. TaxID=306 RepID=UPI003CC6394F
MALHAVAHLDQLDERHATRVKAGEQDVVLLRVGDNVRAFQADCPHAGAPLDEGAVCEHRLICPWHKAAFAVDDGEVCEPPALSRLTRYPAHVQKGEVWVDDQPQPAPVPTPREPARSLVIVGGGAAGAAAVARLDSKGFAGRLVWVDAQESPSYDRTALSKFVIAGDMPAEQTPALLDEQTQASPNLLHLHATVSHIDAKAKAITLADGQQLAYDGALVATGGIAQRPDIPGALLPGTHVLRSRDHAAQLLDAARQARRVVIIGSSFIALEAASALCQLGVQVHVVSRHAVPMAKVLGDEIGRALRDLHQQHGVVFHAPTEPVAVEGDTHVQTVLLANGERLATDLVLFGTGVKPATDLLKGLPLAQDQSLLVDTHLSAAEGLWAAGDMVTFPFNGQAVRIEHWRVAQQQAWVAVDNLLGDAQVYADVPFFWTYHHNKTLEVLGHASDWDHTTLEGDLPRFQFIALHCRADQVLAVVACGYSRAMAALAQRMKQPLGREQAQALIHSWDIA